MKIRVPPIKTQGIKTKLVPFIRETIAWDPEQRWIEPFLGSGSVAFNIRPKRALLCDANPHLIRFYQQIQKSELTAPQARDFLEEEGNHLKERGEGHYYYIRDRFNNSPNSLDFLFLNRSCFNGMIRFNRKGGFNVPFCRKPDRFRPAYITKIVNQIEWVSEVIRGGDFLFALQDWRKTVSQAEADDFLYLDPPYVARTTDYHGSWTHDDNEDLARTLQQRVGPFALSTWLENRYRRNGYVDEHFFAYPIKTREHFYHLGATESLRNSIVEALITNHDTAELSREAA